MTSQQSCLVSKGLTHFIRRLLLLLLPLVARELKAIHLAQFCQAVSQRVWPGLLGIAFVSFREPAEGAHQQLNMVFLCLCLNNEIFWLSFLLLFCFYSQHSSVTNACDSLSSQIAGSLGARTMENSRLHIQPT